MNTPVLEIERLILRPFCREDAADVLYCWESDPDVAKYMFWTSHNDIEKTKEWIDFELGQIEKHDWYRFAMGTIFPASCSRLSERLRSRSFCCRCSIFLPCPPEWVCFCHWPGLCRA